MLGCGEDTLGTREGTYGCGPSLCPGGSGCVQGWMAGQIAREEDTQQASPVPASSAPGLPPKPWPEALLRSPQSQRMPGSTRTHRSRTQPGRGSPGDRQALPWSRLSRRYSQ